MPVTSHLGTQAEKRAYGLHRATQVAAETMPVRMTATQKRKQRLKRLVSDIQTLVYGTAPIPPRELGLFLRELVEVLRTRHGLETTESEVSTALGLTWKVREVVEAFRPVEAWSEEGEDE